MFQQMIRELTISDYEDIIRLFKSTPGVTFREVDSYEALERYLRRNSSLSFVAQTGPDIAGCVLCGHDGRRGYLNHLVVGEAYKNQGIGQALVEKCVDALAKEGIFKTHIFVFKTNDTGNAFWGNRGWQRRDDVNMYSFNSSDSENA